MFKKSKGSTELILVGVAAGLLLVTLVVFVGLGSGGAYAPTRTLPEGIERDNGRGNLPDPQSEPIHRDEPESEPGARGNGSSPSPPGSAAGERNRGERTADRRQEARPRRGNTRLLDDAEVAWPKYPHPAFSASEQSERPRGEATLSGTLTDTREQALAEARVSWALAEQVNPHDLDAASAQATTISDEQGTFQFDELPEEELALWGEAPYHLPSVEPRVEPDGEASVKLEAERFGVLVGRVIGREGEAIPEFTVSFRYLGTGRPAVEESEKMHEAGDPMFPDPFDPQPQTVFRYTFRDVESGRFGLYLGVGRFEVHVTGAQTRPRTMIVNTQADDIHEATFRLAKRTTLEGRVYLDDDDEFPPVSGAMVMIRDARGSELTGRGVTTDEEGRFEVPVYYQGEARVIVNHMNYDPLTERIEIQSSGRQALELPLSPGKIVVGTVTDADGQPVEDLTVWIRGREEEPLPPGVRPPRPGELGRRGITIGGTTDEEGQFRAYGLTPGEWVVVTDNAHGFYETHHPFEIQEGVRTTPVHLEVGRGIDVEVTVEVGNGQLPAGASVFLHRDQEAGATRQSPEHDPDYEYSPAQEFYTVWTEEPGVRHVVIEGVYPGSYRARVNHDAVRFNTKPVEIRDGAGEQSIILRIELGDTFTGVVLDAEHDPVRGASIAWYSLRDADAARRASTNEQGEFEVLGVVEGPSLLVVNAEGFREWWDEIEIGSDPPQVEVVLDRGATLAGRLLAPDGTRYPRGQILLIQPGREQGIRHENLPEGVSVGRRGPVVGTVRDGHFEIEGLEPGRYDVEVRGTEYYWPDGQTVEVRPPKTSQDFHLERGARLRGTVTGPDGEPVQRTLVRLMHAEAEAHGRVQPENIVATGIVAGGEYDIRGFPGGSYRLLVDVAGFLPYSKRLDVYNEQRHDITLSRGHAIRGTVYDVDGQPMSATLTAQPAESGMSSGHGRAGENGRYEVTGLKPGRYVVQVIDRRSRMVVAEREVDLDDADVSGVDFHAERLETYEVRGRVVNAEGQPQSNLTLSLMHPEQPGVSQRVSTGMAGNFHFRDLAPGTYHIKAASRSGAALEPVWTVTVENENVRGLELEVGQAVSGARLVQVRAGSPAYRAGLRSGDVVTDWNGQQVHNVGELREVASRAARNRDGGLIEVRFLREGSASSTHLERQGLESLGIRLR